MALIMVMLQVFCQRPNKELDVFFNIKLVLLGVGHVFPNEFIGHF